MSIRMEPTIYLWMETLFDKFYSSHQDSCFFSFHLNRDFTVWRWATTTIKTTRSSNIHWFLISAEYTMDSRPITFYFQEVEWEEIQAGNL